MKPSLILTAALTALLLAACGQKDTAPAPAAATASADQGPRIVAITAGDTMKYDVTQIYAKPGEDLEVLLTNNGTQPKEAMAHDWVLLKAGSDVAAFAAAAAAPEAKDTGYIPAALQSEILAHIDLLGPQESGKADFKAPTVPGDYPYLCTFPAHYQVGMKGTLTVK